MVSNKFIDERITRAVSSDGSLDLSNLGQVDFTQLEARLNLEIEARLNRDEAVHSIVSLDLSGNDYSEIDGSALASALPGLANLNLSQNSLTRFPVELVRTTALSSLNLNGNGIRTLSIGHAKLLRLRRLSVARNGLENIADDIEALTALEVFDLTGNLLLDLPLGLSALVHLRELLIGDNPGLAPSSSIAKLRNLRLLDLSDNHLKSLPAELGSLHPDITIRLGGNFFDDVLNLASDKNDTRTILEILRSRSDAVPNYEAKLILVGEGNVGKTSIVEALLEHPFIEKRDTTHGIEIKSLLIPNSLPAADEPLTLRSWDFGGQEVYRVTHQFFFSPRAIYLVAWRPREGRDENSVEEWLKRIWLRIGDQGKAIIVATHGGERRAELDVGSLRGRFSAVLTGTCTVDSRTGEGFDALRDLLGHAAAGLPQIGAPVSRRWMEVRNQLLGSPEAHVKRSVFDRICERNDVPDGEADILAQLLSDLGYIVYFPDDSSLRDIIVLQPEWLTKAISYVLEDQETADQGGILEHTRLATLWSAKRGIPSRLHPFFLRLMEKFDVSYRIPEYDRSLIGQLVPYTRPDFDASVADSPVSLKLHCRFSDEPSGLIPWLIVRNHRFSAGTHWRRGVLLRHPAYDTDALFELIEPKALMLSVHGKAPGFFFDILRDTLEHLCSTRWPGLIYHLSVPCPQRQGCPGMFPLRSLERLRDARQSSVQCLECLRSSDVQQLLTGFESTPGTTLEIVRRDLSALRQDLATNLLVSRTIVKALSSEVVDCPRLFTLSLSHGHFDRTNFWSHRYSLTLWCEEPGAEHQAGQSYSFRRPRQWFEDVAPYLRLAARVVSVIAPVVGGIAAVIGDDRSETVRTADLMKAIADAVDAPIPAVGSRLNTSQLTPAEGAALRRLRELLLELDPTRKFAGLRRVLSPTGDYLWLCEDHFNTYEPQLPKLPYRTGPN